MAYAIQLTASTKSSLTVLIVRFPIRWYIALNLWLTLVIHRP
jgi:hypothetical protein